MSYDRDLSITIGSSRWSTSWQTIRTTWTDFCGELREPKRIGTETLAQFLKMKKADQDERKDVGGFVGGVVEGGRRKVGAVKSRDLITLDLDSIPSGKTDTIIGAARGMGYACAIYSTRKHRPEAPRLRVIWPTDRTMDVNEYEPVARQLAQIVGIDWCDPTTYELNRLMFWPSVCKDSEYICEIMDGRPVPVDRILARYADWHDITQWPVGESEQIRDKQMHTRMQDPTIKDGLIGAFCRTYTIHDAIAAFLPEVYEQVSEDRYTYLGGTTAGGAVVYEDKYLYSHHATDPCSGQEVNAFDLVRLHKFGNLDEDVKEGTPVTRTPSYKAMEELAGSDAQTMALLQRERSQKALEAFNGIGDAPAAAGAEDELPQLEMTKDGKVKRTISNAQEILEKDPRLKGRIARDVFLEALVATGPMPWEHAEDLEKWKKGQLTRRRWTDADDASLHQFVEACYGLSPGRYLDDALTVCFNRHRVNEVEEYLRGLTWDRKPRLDTMFLDYFDTDDNVYTRAAARKIMIAAVDRAINGGTKFDYMVILNGGQGIGKSTFIRLLGHKWFSDSLCTFSGKEAAELLQGSWILEIGELATMNKSEVEDVKQFLSKNTDSYRAAYARRKEDHPRRCVFFGTSNDTDFLRDMTGNRRFWPIDVRESPEKRERIFHDLESERDQIWAEAYYRWLHPEIYGEEKLYMDGREAQELALEAQEAHRDDNGWASQIQTYLEETMVPEGWYNMDLQERRMWLHGRKAPLPDGAEETLVHIDRVCVVQIWEECFGRDLVELGRRPQDRQAIRQIMERMPGWQRVRTPRKLGKAYGSQRCFERSNPPEA